jgi:hypothetical protein
MLYLFIKMAANIQLNPIRATRCRKKFDISGKQFLMGVPAQSAARIFSNFHSAVGLSAVRGTLLQSLTQATGIIQLCAQLSPGAQPNGIKRSCHKLLIVNYQLLIKTPTFEVT